MKKTAVILFNLGGPDRLENVRPFLFNLFRDKAIINLPALLRWPLAALISKKREKEARHIYEQIGGRSPLLENTQAQAKALEKQLNQFHQPLSPPAPQPPFRCFTLMRYWHPMAAEVAEAVKAYAPDDIIYLPLYPHYSTSTTASSFKDCDEALGPLAKKVRKICCYPTEKGFVSAQALLIAACYRQVLAASEEKGITRKPRMLFSAHGLPEKLVKAGDPYQAQVEMTTRAVVAELSALLGADEQALDWVNCYQSRVGPLRWIGPYTDAEIERAGAEKTPLLIVPIAFVSEHSETLYEIEQQYRALAAEKGVPVFARVPTVSTHPAFIEGLAALVEEARTRLPGSSAPEGGKKVCPATFKKCGCAVR